MKLTFDTDSILFGLMKQAFSTAGLTGGVYSVARPLSSSKEDVVVNTITLSQEHLPQLGYSNVNIHVPDMVVTVESLQQTMPNAARLKALTTVAVNAIRAANITGLTISVEFQTTIDEPEIKQHYANIRISWSIHN